MTSHPVRPQTSVFGVCRIFLVEYSGSESAPHGTGLGIPFHEGGASVFDEIVGGFLLPAWTHVVQFLENCLVFV